MHRTYIIKPKDGKPRMVEAASRRAVEGFVLQDYSIEQITAANAQEAVKLGQEGVQIEKLE